MPEAVDAVEEPSVIAFAGELAGSLLYLGALFLIPTALLAVPIYWVLAGAYIPTVMSAIAPADSFRPLLNVAIYLFSCIPAFLAVVAFLTGD
jgi:hypothetical protein